MRRVHLLLLWLSRKCIQNICHVTSMDYCGMIRGLAFPILYFWIWISYLNSAQGHWLKSLCANTALLCATKITPKDSLINFLQTSFSHRFHKFNAEPGVWHFQPAAQRGEPGHGPAPFQLLHCLLSQHVPDRRPTPVPLQDRHVRLGAAVRLPLRGGWARHD